MASRAGSNRGQRNVIENNRSRSADLLSTEDTTPDLSWHVLVDRLLHKDVIPPPKIFHKTQNIISHLKAVERYMSALHIVKTQSKVATLLNTLDEDVQTELYAQSDFEQNESDYNWITETLLNLYRKKSTSMSPLLHLLSIKQKTGQNLDQYGTELRVEAYRHWQGETNAQKEVFLVKAFVKGILNRNLAVAIQSAQPVTLDQALQLAKKCIKTHDIPGGNEMDAITGHMRAINQKDTITIQVLHHQILNLQEQIRRLESLIRYSDKRTFAEVAKINNHVPNTSYQRPKPNVKPNFIARNPAVFKPQRHQSNVQNQGDVVCYNCNESGHISRNCPSRGSCYRCGGSNHMARNCPQAQNNGHQRRQFVRHIIPETSNGSVGGESIVGDENEAMESCSNDDGGECYAMEEMCSFDKGASLHANTSQRKKKQHLYSSTKAQNLEAEAWSKYIKGDIKKPKSVVKKSNYPQTLISESRSEPARNKPIVVGKCAGEKTKLFLDSGAEMNVMDGDFLNSLILKQIPIKFTPGSSKIQCANGSQMATTGYATLALEIGNAKSVQKFIIVKSLFPKVIVGIRAMKTMGVIIDPSSDCAVVDRTIRVPFISHVAPQSNAKCCVGKEMGPFMGARKSPSEA